MRIEVPFYTQHWDLDAWNEMGYKNREDAAYWERSCCGILCIKMAIDALGNVATPSVKGLIDLGISRGAYADATGWSHDGLVGLVKEFGLEAEKRSLSVTDIQTKLGAGALAIVSIKWGFRQNKNLKEKILFWRKYGGHLAVVVGYKEENGKLVGFYVHHTSKLKEQNWENRLILLGEFKKGFTGRGIIVSSGS